MSTEKIIRINTTDEQSLENGAREVVDMLGDIETFIARRSQRVCATCGDLEWMNSGESVCWRCWRISQGLAVAIRASGNKLTREHPFKRLQEPLVLEKMLNLFPEAS